MKTKLLLSLLTLSGVVAQAQIRSVRIEPVEPIRYEKQDGKLKLLSSVKLDGYKGGALSVTLDNASLKYNKTGKSDSITLWVPMVGDRNNIIIKSGGKVIADQMIQAMIPSDWGYFKNGTIHIIQSSHQDIGWMDTPAYCREERIKDIIMPALDMMNEDPDFTFQMEQTLNLMELLEAHPEKRDDIIKFLKSKRFMWGATYNQPYEGLQSGEQMVRESYFGKKWILDNLDGADDRTANNIDVPGRSMQVPQIMAKSGIDNLFISRMREGLYDWYSPDGSKVLTFTPGNYGWANLKWKFFEKDAVTAFHKLHHRTILWSDYYKQHKIEPHYAILMSCDATKPVNFTKLINEWNKISEMSEIELPKLVSSTTEVFLEKVRGKNTEFEKVSGERPDLWLYIHGPAHYQATVAKREAGVLLPAAETFTSFVELQDNNLGAYPKSVFDRAWIASIYPDHGLGGKNGHITDSIFCDSLQTAKRIGEKLLGDALRQIAVKVKGNESNVVVLNDLSWIRNDLVCVEVDGNYIVKDENGVVLPSQSVIKDGKRCIMFFANGVPAMGYKSYTLNSGNASTNVPKSVKQNANYYENAFYKMTFVDGGLGMLWDKKLGKDVLLTTKYSGGDIIEAAYKGNGAGEFTQSHPLDRADYKMLSSQKSLWSVVENGPLYSIYESVQPTEHTTIIQRIKVYHNVKKVDFDVTMKDFTGAHGRQYRIALPLNMNMTDKQVAYEVPMGILEVGKHEMKTIPGGWGWEGTYTQRPEEITPREVQNFMSVSGNGIGVTMSMCVAVADWVDPAREMADYPVMQGIMISSHKSCHGEGNWYEQKGTHNFNFSVTSHPEGWKNGYHFGIEANHPLKAVRKATNGGTLPQAQSFISVSNPFVSVSTVKRADSDNSLIVRLVEMEGKDKNITLTLLQPVKKVVKTNMIEQEQEVVEGVSGTKITLPIGHHAIDTYKLIF